MATHSTLYTSGRHLHDRHGHNLVLRGLDLPLLDNWDFPVSDALEQIGQTGANAIRIQWYVQYPNPSRPPFSVTDLDRVLHRCNRADIVPIVMLADLTCASDVDQLNATLVPWWTSSDVVAVLRDHANCVIVNLANELGNYRWADAPDAALGSYQAAYATAIASFRATGLSVPLMIDAPDCGTSIDAFLSVGEQLISADPDHNILLSGHAYWAAYDGLSYIPACMNAALPIVFGEIANKQDESINGETVYCYYDLDGTHENPGTTNGFTYQALLSACQQHGLGWLAWSWGPDNCTARRISSDGSFASLTPYGVDIVHNPVYGLLATARRAKL